jgi:hypothetical protein
MEQLITFYQLSFFDVKQKIRRLYLNGTSWLSQDHAEKEYSLIIKHDPKNKKGRNQWQLECVENKKRRTVKLLN